MSAHTEFITPAEAEAISRALDALKAIETRASSASYNRPSSIGHPDTVRAQDCGRLAATADLAGDCLFHVLNVAGNYCHDAAANDTMTRRHR